MESIQGLRYFSQLLYVGITMLYFILSYSVFYVGGCQGKGGYLISFCVAMLSEIA